jgi:T5orf172 domain
MNNNVDEHGYIYCFSNPSFDGILKVGITRRDPRVYAEELSTIGVPTPFVVEFAKRVKSPEYNERNVNDKLDEFGYRVDTYRAYFRCDKSVIYRIFGTFNGTWYKTEPQKPLLNTCLL